MTRFSKRRRRVVFGLVVVGAIILSVGVVRALITDLSGVSAVHAPAGEDGDQHDLLALVQSGRR